MSVGMLLNVILTKIMLYYMNFILILYKLFLDVHNHNAL